LGAGASADVGLPVMNNFMLKAEDLLSSNLLSPEETKSFENILETVHQIKGISYQLKNDLGNIENIFGLLDMGRMLGRLGDVPQAKIEELYLDIQKVIGLTIDFNTTLYKDRRGRVKINGPLHSFVEILDEYYFKNGRNNAAIITLNYDLALEYALQHYGLLPNYFIDGQEILGRVPLLKLHGSLNWAISPEGNLLNWDLSKLLNEVGTLKHGTDYSLVVSKYFFNNQTPLGTNISKPFIVPPTWNKGQHHSQIGSIWRKAVDYLLQAQAIYIIGYSMPETDMFFRHLLSLGTYSKTNIRRLWVYDIAKEVGKRFEAIIGDGLRPAFDFQEIPFQSAIKHIAEKVRLT